MRDALGGSVNVIIIVVFIVFIMGYMAFNVNYTKAFRMKNKIIAVYEEYDGKCDSKCEKEIQDYARSIGYYPDTSNNFRCPKGYAARPGGSKLYCLKPVDVTVRSESGSVDEKRTKTYYKIITKITISIPVLDNLVDLNVFQVTGDTKAMLIEETA